MDKLYEFCINYSSVPFVFGAAAFYATYYFWCVAKVWRSWISGRRLPVDLDLDSRSSLKKTLKALTSATGNKLVSKYLETRYFR